MGDVVPFSVMHRSTNMLPLWSAPAWNEPLERYGDWFHLSTCYTTIESLGKRISLRDGLHWIGLWACLWHINCCKWSGSPSEVGGSWGITFPRLSASEKLFVDRIREAISGYLQRLMSLIVVLNV